MKVDPTLGEIVYGERGMLKGIEVCLEAQCLVSAVSLILAAIDALSALKRPKPGKDATRQDFKNWVGKYIQPEQTLGCTPTELYSARCAVLHNYGTESRLVREEGVRQIIYEWKHGPSAGEAVDIPQNSIVIKVEALNRAFRRGIEVFLYDADMDEKTKKLIEPNLKTLLCYKPYPYIMKTLVA